MELLKWLSAQWDRTTAWVAIALGGLVLVLGYLGISDTPYVTEQLPYIISGGLFGVFLLGIGGMLWLSADLRDEWRKLDDLDRRLAEFDLMVPGVQGAEDSELAARANGRPARATRSRSGTR